MDDGLVVQANNISLKSNFAFLYDEGVVIKMGGLKVAEVICSGTAGVDGVTSDGDER